MLDRIEWNISKSLIDYNQSIEEMELKVKEIQQGISKELVWLLEHPPLFTAGTSSDPSELLDSFHLPVYHTGRGGKYTYHGPGQRIAYVMLDLVKQYKDNPPDIRDYVYKLEEWIIRTLNLLNVDAFRRKGRIGIWVLNNQQEAKIAAIGIRVKKWVTFHGVALNNDLNLSHYKNIIPCGIKEYGVTSLKDMGKHLPTEELDTILQEKFFEVFE